MVLFAADFPAGFEFVTPRPGELVRPRTDVHLDLAGIRRPGPPRPAPLPRRLEFAGALVLAEVDRTGNEYAVVVDPLYCLSVETVRRNSDGSGAAVLLRLVDARYFHAQGFLRRWSFNRTDGEGVYSRDSLKESGEPWTLAEIAAEAAQGLFGSPRLARCPESWKSQRPSVELPVFGPAGAGLLKLAQEHGAGELCLALDGSVGLYSPGEGRVGYAPGGKGPENTADLPPTLLLDLQGTGQGRGWEATYPPDFLVIVGGLRIASVRVDDLEPVLVLDGYPLALTEDTVMKLTGGRFGLPWLQVFVLAPQAYQNALDLDPRVVKLFREQAYRLWRIPGVEVEQAFQEGDGFPGSSTPAAAPPRSLSAAPLPSFEQIVAGLRGASAGEPARVKGPNAHLLPLLDRAETVAGRRLPVRVDSYRFASVHRAMGPDSQEAVDAATARKELAALRAEIKERARTLGKPDPFDGASWYLGFDSRYMSAPELQGLLQGLELHHVTDEDLQRAIGQHRLLDRIKEVSGAAAASYQKNLERLHELASQSGSAGKGLFDLAGEIVQFEREVAKSRDAFETPGEEAREQAGRLRDRIQDRLRALDREAEDQRRRSRLGARTGSTPRTAVFVRNLPRELDPDARVYSAELGIVQTSDLSGHLAEEGVPVAEATSFVPKSPLATFGAVLRPQLGGGRPRTGGGGSSETKIPSVLSDRESYYTAAFRRTARSRAERIEVDAIPIGQGLALPRPDLVELVPLEGESNRVRLDETAAAVAAGVFARAERVEQARYSIARPWPVNTDGVVAGVEIALRPYGKGFVTTIHTGSEAPELAPLDRTRPRVPRRVPQDGPAREGLLP